MEVNNAKIFVRNLNYDTTEDQLRVACEVYGAVLETRIIKDHATRRSRGFGFVSFENPEHAQKAIEGLHGTTFHNRLLHVELAQQRKQLNS